MTDCVDDGRTEMELGFVSGNCRRTWLFDITERVRFIEVDQIISTESKQAL